MSSQHTTSTPATEAQARFLRTLLTERAGMADAEAIRSALNIARTTSGVSKALASEAITKLMAIKVERKAEAVTVTEEGFYFRDEDQAIFQVVEGKVGGRFYAKRLHGATEAGKKGHFEYDAGAIYTLTPAMLLTPERGAEIGRMLTWCVRCGAWLEHADSVEAGYGPVCAKKLGVLYGPKRRKAIAAAKAREDTNAGVSKLNRLMVAC